MDLLDVKIVPAYCIGHQVHDFWIRLFEIITSSIFLSRELCKANPMGGATTILNW